ncbi:unnamed protein product [Linum trigynum]|uniref:Uncharacterized protein n=1 Tax=Linum trigynum TaxID=586398 RepID=A0AAV2FZD0_9ROSI
MASSVLDLVTLAPLIVIDLHAQRRQRRCGEDLLLSWRLEGVSFGVGTSADWREPTKSQAGRKMKILPYKERNGPVPDGDFHAGINAVHRQGRPPPRRGKKFEWPQE